MTTIDGNLHQQYEDYGVVGPINVLTSDEAFNCLVEVEGWIDRFDGAPLGDERFKPHLHLPFINQIVRHPKLVKSVKAILKSDNILCWSSDFNVKKAKSQDIYSPHQDATYTGLEPPALCLTAWVALSDPVGTSEGCLEFFAGSHHRGQVRHLESTARSDNNLLSRGQYIDISPEEKPICIPLRGGQATLHHFHTIHQSGPNKSDRNRIGLAIRYMAASVTQTGKVRESVTLISGRSEHKGFDLEPILPPCPTHDDVRRGKEAHVVAMQREAANYFDGSPTARAYDELLS
jgi:non-haem Fe2+, alpha-ketoglutarate-dependent halogenase